MADQMSSKPGRSRLWLLTRHSCCPLTRMRKCPGRSTLLQGSSFIHCKLWLAEYECIAHINLVIQLGKNDCGSIVFYTYLYIVLISSLPFNGTVSAKIAPWLKCYKNASRLNRYNCPTDNAIDFLFSTLHTTPFHYDVLKIGSR